MELSKRVRAARQAVNTNRKNKIASADIKELRGLFDEIINKEFATDDNFTIDAIIAREIGKTTWRSFCSFGDRRNCTQSLILKWIDNKAIPLDTQCIFINEDYGTEILPEQLASFMMEYDRGKLAFPEYSELRKLKDTFKQLAGFNWNLKFVKENILQPVCISTASQEDYF